MDLEQVDIDVVNFRLDIVDVEEGTSAEAGEDLAVGTAVDMLSVVWCIDLGVIDVIKDVPEAATGYKEYVVTEAMVVKGMVGGSLAEAIDWNDDEEVDGKDIDRRAAEENKEDEGGATAEDIDCNEDVVG